MNKKVWIIIFAIAAVLVAFTVKYLTAVRVQKQTRFLMDTIVTIQIPGGSDKIPVIAKALDRMEEIDKKFNALNETSQVYRFNKKNIPIDDPEIIHLTKLCLDLSVKSGGLYDITLFPISELWGFYSDNPHIPPAAEIKRLLKHTGYRKIYIRKNKLYKTDPLVELDYGSKAKGYAVGEAIKVIKKEGVKNALVDAGGDIFALGTYKGRPWKVGIKNPRGEGVIGSMEISDMTVATSGDYERYFIKDGIRYCHIMDPRTGSPRQGIASAVIITDEAEIADGWTSALFLMGEKKGIAAVDKEPGLSGMVITADMKKYYSKKFSGETENKRAK